MFNIVKTICESNETTYCGKTVLEIINYFESSWKYNIYLLYFDEDEQNKKLDTVIENKPFVLDPLEIEDDERFEDANINIDDIVTMAQKLVDINEIIFCTLGLGDMLGHTFALFKDSSKYYIADSYVNTRKCEIREFDFDTFHELLEDLEYTNWNSFFKCEEEDYCFGGDYLEIHFQYKNDDN